MTGAEPAEHAVAVGDHLADRYELQGLLGEGGMSRVFLALDHDLGRHVAVKLLLDRGDGGGDGDDGLARLRDEARAAAAVDHPGVVTVYDVGSSAAGLYVVMAYVAGETLAQRIDRDGPMPPAEVVRIGRAVCDALDAAHRAGVVHRDVSPGNVVLRPDGGVVVTDFGIARIGAGAGRTRTGYVLGTPSYLAPEQGRSTGGTDGRADLYSLGCCLFAALTGRPPFTDPDAFAVVLAHLRDTPPRAASLRPDVPPALDDVLARTLAKDPARRPRDARALADELGRSLGAAPDSGPPRTRPVDDPPSVRPMGRSAPERSTGSHALDSAIADVEGDDGTVADRRRGVGLGLIVLAVLLVLGAVAALAVLG